MPSTSKTLLFIHTLTGLHPALGRPWVLSIYPYSASVTRNGRSSLARPSRAFCAMLPGKY